MNSEALRLTLLIIYEEVALKGPNIGDCPLNSPTSHQNVSPLNYNVVLVSDHADPVPSWME